MIPHEADIRPFSSDFSIKFGDLVIVKDSRISCFTTIKNNTWHAATELFTGDILVPLGEISVDGVTAIHCLTSKGIFFVSRYINVNNL